MKTKIILTLVSLVIARVTIFFSLASMRGITGEVVADRYTYTKAVCNSTNYCEDYEIVCEGAETISMIFTGFAVQNPSYWKDSRDEEEINKIC